MQAISSIVFYRLESLSYVLSIPFVVSYTKYSEFNYNLQKTYIPDLIGVMDSSCLGVLKIVFIFKEIYVVPCQEI
jgi:hypothetical protein